MSSRTTVKIVRGSANGHCESPFIDTSVRTFLVYWQRPGKELHEEVLRVSPTSTVRQMMTSRGINDWVAEVI